MTLEWAVDYIEYGGFPNDGSRGNEAWSVIKKALSELAQQPTNKQSTQCQCTGVMHYDAICKSCGLVIKGYSS